MPAEQEIWLRHYAGNFGQNAKTQALLQSISGVVSLAPNPVIAGVADAYGRRPRPSGCPSCPPRSKCRIELGFDK